MDILENGLFKYEDGRIVRILHLNDFVGIVYIIDMDHERMPYVVQKEELISLPKSLQVNCIEDNYIKSVDEGAISEAARKKRDENWEIITHILSQVENQEELFISKYRSKIFQQTCSVYKCSINKVKHLLIYYWKGGMTKNSLLPKYNKCGGKGTERKAGDKKRGRPSSNRIHTGVNVNECIKKYFKQGINKHYLNGKKNSLKFTYEMVVKDFFAEKVTQNGVVIPVIHDMSMIPSYGQFYYWYKKNNNIRHEISTRHGERIFQQNYRTIIGNSTEDADLGPSTLYQIDSTIFDIYLVSSVNRDLIVGRPILTLCIDVYSRMIVGLFIGFESLNSYVNPMLALANSMTPKREFCAKYGIQIEEDNWDCSCIPNRLLSDRGELDSSQIENAIMNLGISIQQTPPYRCDYKGIIEQAFHQMNMRVKPFVDGVVANDYNIVARGDADYRLKSNLTLNEFTEVIIRCIVFYNNSHVLSDYIVDEMMLEEGVEKIPAKIWQYGVKNKKGILRKLPKEFVELSLFPIDEASVTARGVYYKKMLYASSETLKMNWFGLARAKGSWKVKISYNPQDMDEIHVWNSDGKSTQKLFLLDNLKKFVHKSYAEIEQIIDYERDIDSKSKEKELQDKIILFNDLENIVGNARVKTQADEDITKSKSKRLKGIKDNNRDEKEYQRQIKKLTQDTVEEFMNYDCNKFNDDIELIRSIQMEELDG